MKRISLIITLSIITLLGLAQEKHPVSWKMSSEKTGPLTYRIKMEATVDAPFHIYPQESMGGMGMPTAFSFTGNENIELLGKVKEQGLEKRTNRDVAYYAKGVVFSQDVKLKSESKTTLAFTIQYMACTNQYCLAPSRKAFALAINDENKMAQDSNAVDTPSNDKVPAFTYEDFVMPNTAGTMVLSKDITSKSKYTFVDFWASWCIPCRAQGRELIPVYNRYKSKGFSVIGVSLDTNPTAWKKAIEADKYTWTNVSDLKGFESAMARKYHITAIPRNFLIDDSGNIIAKDLHGKELETKLTELFQK
jgi:thiol-disulfide isomerase/thioredoxin